MQYIKHDGGRSQHYGKKKTGDCVVRAIALATDGDYKQVFTDLCAISQPLGLFANDNLVWHQYLKNLGWQEIKLKRPWSKVQDLDIHTGIVVIQRHIAAIVQGDLYDTGDCRTSTVYSYWKT